MTLFAPLFLTSYSSRFVMGLLCHCLGVGGRENAGDITTLIASKDTRFGAIVQILRTPCPIVSVTCCESLEHANPLLPRGILDLGSPTLADLLTFFIRKLLMTQRMRGHPPERVYQGASTPRELVVLLVYHLGMICAMMFLLADKTSGRWEYTQYVHTYLNTCHFLSKDLHFQNIHLE